MSKNPTIKVLLIDPNCVIFLSLQTLFGKDADKLEHATDDECTYYIIEKEPLVNKFISVPKDKGSLNCAVFVAGIIQAVLSNCGFVSSAAFPLFYSFPSRIVALLMGKL